MKAGIWYLENIHMKITTLHFNMDKYYRIQMDKHYKIWKDPMTGFWLWTLTPEGKRHRQHLETSCNDWLKSLEHDDRDTNELVDPLDFEAQKYSYQ